MASAPTAGARASSPRAPGPLRTTTPTPPPPPGSSRRPPVASPARPGRGGGGCGGAGGAPARRPGWLRRGGVSAVSAKNIDRIADSLERFKPQLLCAYPSALEALCRLLQERGRTLSVPAVLTSSEVLKPEAWALAQDVLGCRIADYYGQSERVAF